MVRISIEKEKLNTRYHHFVVSDLFTVLESKRINKEDKIFCMDSCFAEELRLALAENFEIFPKLDQIKINTQSQKLDELPDRQHVNFYNSTNIRNELAIAAKQFNYTDDDVFAISRKNHLHPDHSFYFQDPYRRQVYGTTLENLLDVRQQLENAIAEGLSKSDVFIFTFGLNEVFRRKSNNNVISQYPQYGGNDARQDCYVDWLTFNEVVTDLHEIVRLCKKITRKKAPEIFFTVSPVPLIRTFSKEFDIYTVNSASKANLLAAIHEVVRSYDFVNYFESYEVAQILGNSAFEDDGRHVKGNVVEKIIELFTARFVK